VAKLLLRQPHHSSWERVMSSERSEVEPSDLAHFFYDNKLWHGFCYPFCYHRNNEDFKAKNDGEKSKKARKYINGIYY
jgi:hypothetical protein